jgi:hypothetical protein
MSMSIFLELDLSVGAVAGLFGLRLAAPVLADFASLRLGLVGSGITDLEVADLDRADPEVVDPEVVDPEVVGSCW